MSMATSGMHVFDLGFDRFGYYQNKELTEGWNFRFVGSFLSSIW